MHPPQNPTFPKLETLVLDGVKENYTGPSDEQQQGLRNRGQRVGQSPPLSSGETYCLSEPRRSSGSHGLRAGVAPRATIQKPDDEAYAFF